MTGRQAHNFLPIKIQSITWSIVKPQHSSLDAWSPNEQCFQWIGAAGGWNAFDERDVRTRTSYVRVKRWKHMGKRRPSIDSSHRDCGHHCRDATAARGVEPENRDGLEHVAHSEKINEIFPSCNGSAQLVRELFGCSPLLGQKRILDERQS